jgi:hypothetical protein
VKVDETGEFRSALMRLRKKLSGPRPVRPDPAVSVATLDKVEKALRRLDDDSYGICAGCFLIIPRGQLLRRPYADTCSDCASRRRTPAPLS